MTGKQQQEPFITVAVRDPALGSDGPVLFDRIIHRPAHPEPQEPEMPPRS